MNIDTKILIDEFLKWYTNDEHSKNEDYYKETLTFENLSHMKDDELISFFEQFAKDSGKIQTGGQKTAPKFIENIRTKLQEFRQIILAPFNSDFKLDDWLNWVSQFNYFGQGLATIYLNRIDKHKYTVVNGKSVKAYVELGYSVTEGAKLPDLYKQLQNAQKDIINKHPEIENYYKADALSHYLISKSEAKEPISKNVSTEKSFLNNLITELKNIFVEEKHPLAYHEWKNNDAENYRQISVVPSTFVKSFVLHYEIVIYNKGICFEIHHEGSKKKTEFLKMLDNLTNEILKSYELTKWSGTKKIVHKTKINNDDTNIVQKLYTIIKGTYKDFNKLLSDYYLKVYYGNTNENIETKKANMPLNQILFGPPGTGKTYHTINKSVEIADNEFYNKNKENRTELKRRFKELKESNQVIFTTFHQSMSYEEFLESLKPFEKDEKVYYKIEDGIFKLICEKAEEKPTENFVLIIDEINRGNIASIFGELITLIEPDKRKGEDEELSVKLPYSKEDFTVPKNLYIIGTMNTADRSVEAIDSALRRRFVFEEMPPDETLLVKDFFGINLQEVIKKINLRIEKLIDKDHKIGHSYFMNLKTEIDLQNAFKNKIIPLLEEYFYGDFAKIGLVLGLEFVSKNNFEENIFKNIDDIDNYTDFENRVIYKTTIPENVDEFINAVKNIYL